MKYWFAGIFLLVLNACATPSASIPPSSASSGFVDLAWSPDSRTIAYTQFGVRSVFLLALNATNARRIQTPGQVGYLSWSPDGDRIVFAMRENRQGMDDLYVMRIADGSLTQLTRDPARETQPSWAPNGEDIAFVSNRSGRLQLYVMSADGGEARALVEAPGDLYNPQWSPDGEHIVFFSELGDHQDQIWIVGADGSALRNITHDQNHNFYPSWSGDGRSVVFTVERDDSPEIYRVDLNSGARELLVSDNAFVARPSPNGRWLAYIKRLADDSPIHAELWVATRDGARARVVAYPVAQ